MATQVLRFGKDTVTVLATEVPHHGSMALVLSWSILLLAIRKRKRICMQAEGLQLHPLRGTLRLILRVMAQHKDRSLTPSSPSSPQVLKLT